MYLKDCRLQSFIPSIPKILSCPPPKIKPKEKKKKTEQLLTSAAPGAVDARSQCMLYYTAPAGV